jgi:hypothetical protein
MKIHVRHNGKSQTLDGDELGITARAGDQDIKQVLSRIYEIPARELKNLVIDRNPDGIVVRPPAVFG